MSKSQIGPLVGVVIGLVVQATPGVGHGEEEGVTGGFTQ